MGIEGDGQVFDIKDGFGQRGLAQQEENGGGPIRALEPLTF